MEDSGIDSDSRVAVRDEPDGPPNNTHGNESDSPSEYDPPQQIVVYGSKRKKTSQIQKKLEARIDEAKRNHRMQEYKKSQQSLISIQRLPIPGVVEQQQPLVDWDDTDDSEEDIVNFFPLSRTKDTHKHQELSDTFSIEEMNISEENDEEDEDLQLVPPAPLKKRYYCCDFTPTCNIM